MVAFVPTGRGGRVLCFSGAKVPRYKCVLPALAPKKDEPHRCGSFISELDGVLNLKKFVQSESNDILRLEIIGSLRVRLFWCTNTKVKQGQKHTCILDKRNRRNSSLNLNFQMIWLINV